jgi:glutathione S-transferase
MASDIESQAEALAARVRSLQPGSVEKPVLVYFDIIGICWPIRCLLHVRGVDYDLVQVPAPVWAYRDAEGRQLLPACFRNDRMPLYVDPDVSLTQSNVIMTYLAQKHDMFGDGSAERWAAMEVMAHAYDALFHWGGLFQVNVRMNTPDDVVEARLRAFMGDGTWGLLSDGYRRNLLGFERYLEANPRGDGGFMVGGRLTIADLHAFNVLCNWFKAFDPERFVGEHPGLDAYLHRIASIPAVADYIATRQEPTTWLPIPPLGVQLTTPGDLDGLIRTKGSG